MTMETKDDGAFSHDKADITIVSYVLAAANDGKNAIRVLSDDTDVFVLLVYWNGCLRKGNTSDLVKHLGVLETIPTATDALIVDVSQLFYHIVWPHGGYPSDLIASIQTRLSRYPTNAEKILVFDKYQGVSAKDHERMRRTGAIITDYELSLTNSLPKRDIILSAVQFCSVCILIYK